ncbi:GAF domain-containing protein [Chlorogloeopsis sp. ULAP01]|uniref:GAF domain-containing protein n=1 Tax=Chlorogloeopsis sp. ULAP01 TaxID=3056483 RepID=UPI0025AAD840|nr:GAF domain-containing protein [Chlorogloeopsis sp. ULAP01]MDM9380808.1 GAF domain-containing protein [Chlorogloeopsis sp. ULAP01]
MATYSNSEFNNSFTQSYERGLQKVLDRLIVTMERDELVRQTTNHLRECFQVNRVVLYYFYYQWYGQVTFESLSSEEFSILGSTGPDNCFNDEYAALYLAGRVRGIADIESEAIATCHRDFLRKLQVRANLVAPVLTPKGLWGLLVAHHCQAPRTWTSLDIELIQKEAQTLATAPCIQES